MRGCDSGTIFDHKSLNFLIVNHRMLLCRSASLRFGRPIIFSRSLTSGTMEELNKCCPCLRHPRRAWLWKKREVDLTNQVPPLWADVSVATSKQRANTMPTSRRS